MADLYLDHYERYFGPIAGREVFRAPGGEWSIQILAFDGVFRGCRVYCSLGLTHYSEMIGEAVEVVLPVDPRWDIVPEVLANALFFAIEEKMELGRGVSIAGISQVRPEFVENFGKEALYFTKPVGFPPEFETVRRDSDVGRVLMAIFITSREHRFFCDRGCENFEKLLEEGGVDPFELARTSVI